jgi:hypothetical protein
MLSAVELADARTDLEAELPDTVSISWQDGTTYNPVTYKEEPNIVVRSAAVDALVIPDADRTSAPNEAGEPILFRIYSVTVPHDTTVEAEDILQVTASRDAGMVGLQLTVRDVRDNTVAISRRLRCVVRLTDDPEL